MRAFVVPGDPLEDHPVDLVGAGPEPDRIWQPALEQNGSLRGSAEVAELTGMVDLAGSPDGTRIIVRRERPHPGAQLSLSDLDEGMRHQVFLTGTPVAGGGESIQRLEVRHRAHARVEDRIRCGKATGFDRFPPGSSRSTRPGWSRH